MADVRDPERDQPAPKPGKLPVQQIMILAIEERRAYGKKKYGRILETDNGRDALKDAWEEALDLFTYLTQARLERGDHIEGMERLAGSPEAEYPYGPEGDPEGVAQGIQVGFDSLSLGGSDRPSSAAELDYLIPAACPICRHEPHAPGRCRSQALNLGCSCPSA